MFIYFIFNGLKPVVLNDQEINFIIINIILLIFDIMILF